MTSGPGVPADDGSAPHALVDVLTRHAAGDASVREVIACLAGERVLVPLRQVSVDQVEGDDLDPCAGQGSAMAAVSVRQEDGVHAGLAFTGVAAMSAWDPEARPMPVAASRAAQAVVAAGGRVLLIDPGGPSPCRIEGVALVRLAQGDEWPPPWEDEHVRRAILAELAPALAEGMGVRLGPPEAGERSDLAVQLRFPSGLPAEVAGGRAVVVARRLAGSDVVRAVFDGTLAVSVRSAAIRPPGR